MKILLLQNMLYFPSFGGANKLTRLFMEALSCRGHTCSVVGPAIGTHGLQTLDEHAKMLQRRGVENASRLGYQFRFTHHNVDVVTVAPERLRDATLREIPKFQPDVIIVAAEDPGQMLFQAAFEVSPGNLIYLVQTPWNLPFGKTSINRSQVKTELIRKSRRVVTVSHFMKDYLFKWGNLNSVVMRFPVFGSGPFCHLAKYGRGSVTLVNPSKIKGITVFSALAGRMPDVAFAAVPTWATTQSDLESLRQVPNITLWEPAEEIDAILSRTSVLLVPSLWDEAFGLIVIDAMLRGIPVLASRIGGLVEAKLGVDYLVPVLPIESYETSFDDRRHPVPIVPEQDIEVWETPLRKLLGDRSHYESLSQLSRAAALALVSTIDVTDFEQLLSDACRESRSDNTASVWCASREQRPRAIELEISAEKRTLLALSAWKKASRRPGTNSEAS